MSLNFFKLSALNLFWSFTRLLTMTCIKTYNEIKFDAENYSTRARQSIVTTCYDMISKVKMLIVIIVMANVSEGGILQNLVTVF